jgi:penicillin-binding protein 2
MIHGWKSFLRKIFSRRLRERKEIDPDEIFLDSKNLPAFDVHQFEGRIERPISQLTVFILGGVFVLIGFLFVGKLWALQIKEGKSFSIRSENNHLAHTTIFADRGIISDRNGVELAWNELNPTDEFSLRAYKPISGIAHIVGYLKYPSKDKFGIYYDERYSGMDGAEYEFDDELAGQNGLKITETDALGKVQSESTLRPPKDGKNVALSIDSRVQEKLHTTIAGAAHEYGFTGGAGVVLDIKSGEVLALTSFPEYGSAVLTEGKDKEQIENLLSQKNNPFLNRALGGLYIPGSIIKPYIAVAALEEHLIDPAKSILSTGSISIPNPYNPGQVTIFKDWKAHGWVDMRRAIAVSSNVYFFSIGGGYDGQQGLGITRLNKYLKEFGFAEKTGIDLSGEEEGNVPSPEWKAETFEDEEWRVGDTYNTSIGQYGFQVTPLQAVRSVAAVANNGFLITPTILKLEEGNKTKAEELSFGKDNLQIAREGMRQSAVDGTASGLNMPGLEVAAKTGTAELGVSKEFVNSWSVGYFPYQNPKYAFAILMERGSRHNTIGATYVARQLLEWMYAYTPEYVK